MRASSPLKVLLVEDDLDSRKCLERLLQLAGHFVHSAGCFDSGLAAASSSNVDVAVCDIGLPGRDGWELMAELRSHHQIPCIALTGHSMLEGIETTGIIQLVKPVDFAHLEATLSAVTKNFNKRQESKE